MIKSNSLFVTSRTGCLLPLLIIFNLFFGRVFLKASDWVIVEAILLLLFLLNALILTRKVTSVLKRRDNVIDVDAEVVTEKRKLGKGNS